MASDFFQRYTYGNFCALPVANPGTDSLFGPAARQRELIFLARSQIETQRRAADTISQSNLTAADEICDELQLQTEYLESAIRDSAEIMVDAINNLGDRLSGELTEIRWELAQLRATAGQILEVLKLPRSTEARELLRQGIRNLVNDRIEQAEERFLLALKLDNTDHQILMNLSVVKLRKGEAQSAIQYARAALTLPDDLADAERADGLWHLARLLYAIEEYDSSLKFARQSVALVEQPRRILQVGIYTILSDDLDRGLALMKRAIRQNPVLFAVAASTPDLQPHGGSVLAMLGGLALDVKRELRARLERIDDAAASIPKAGREDERAVARFRAAYRRLGGILGEPSYTRCCSALGQAAALERVPKLLRELNEANRELERRRTAERAAKTEQEQAAKWVNRTPTATVTVSLLVTCGSIVLFVLMLAFFHKEETWLASPARGMRDMFLTGLSPIWGGVLIFWAIKFAQWLATGRLDQAAREAHVASAACKAAQSTVDTKERNLSELLVVGES